MSVDFKKLVGHINMNLLLKEGKMFQIRLFISFLCTMSIIGVVQAGPETPLSV
jgi:hypothetical protein